MAEKEEGGKEGRVESDMNWTASGLANQIMQVQETKIDRDVIVQLSSSSTAAWSKRSSTDYFSKPNFDKLLALSPQLWQPLGQLCDSPLGMVLRVARRQLGSRSLLMVANSCFSSAAKQQLLQQTSTGTGEPSSKRHPVHCAKCHSG